VELLPLLLPAVQQAPPARRASTSTLAASPGHVDGLSSAGMLTEAEFSVVKSAVLAQGLRRCRASEMSCAPQVKSESAELLLAGLSRCQPSHEQSVTAAAPAPPAAVAAEQTDGPVRTAATAQSRTDWNPPSLDMHLFPHIHAVLGPTDPLVVALVRYPCLQLFHQE
jgi:hypothetical protein